MSPYKYDMICNMTNVFFSRKTLASRDQLQNDSYEQMTDKLYIHQCKNGNESVTKMSSLIPVQIYGKSRNRKLRASSKV